MVKAVQLSREALGNRRFKYTVAVTRRVDGLFDLVVAAAGVQGEHKMPEPSPEKRPFTGDDLDDLGTQATAFLRAWSESQPQCGNQVLCCTRVVDNALARARKTLATLPVEVDR